jgi:hypothetical protein
LALPFAGSRFLAPNRRVRVREKHTVRRNDVTQNVWLYRTDLSHDTKLQSKLVGYDVEATDGSIGKIDKASTETDRYYLVVDTGFWIFGKKRLIPAGVVQSIDHNDRRVYVGMTKDQIKSAPDYDESMTTYDDAYYDKYSSYYGTWS